MLTMYKEMQTMRRMEMTANALQGRAYPRLLPSCYWSSKLPSLHNRTLSPYLPPRKPYLSVLNMAFQRTIVLLLLTVAIHLLPCAVVPLMVFLVNYSVTDVVCLMERAVQCTSSLLPSSAGMALWELSNGCWRCVCSEVPW